MGPGISTGAQRAAGGWSLVTECWLLAAGGWLLVAGGWSLVI